MPLHIIREDITRMTVDAIVSPVNERLVNNGGLDGKIHRLAGAGLREACRRMCGVRTGQAKLTPGFDLPCRYVIHTAGPVWQGGDHGETALLRSCYHSALMLAARHKLSSIAFPLISAGQYRFPAEQAISVAVDEIRSFLNEHDMTVYLVVYGSDVFRVSSKLQLAVEAFIDEHYVLAQQERAVRNRWPEVRSCRMADMQAGMEAQQMQEDADWYAEDDACWLDDGDQAECQTAPWEPELHSEPLPMAQTPADWTKAKEAPAPAAAPSLADTQSFELPEELRRRLLMLDESFSQQLLRMIDERGMTDAACYKRANIEVLHGKLGRERVLTREKK